MTRILLFLAMTPSLSDAAGAVSLEQAMGRVDGEAARIDLLGYGTVAEREGPNARWRIGADPVPPPDAADGDIRLKMRLRPNRAMGRVSVAF